MEERTAADNLRADRSCSAVARRENQSRTHQSSLSCRLRRQQIYLGLLLSLFNDRLGATSRDENSSSLMDTEYCLREETNADERVNLI